MTIYHFPLWEAENGKVFLTQEISHPKSISEYTGLSGKYSHLTRQDLDQIQEMTNARYNLIKTLASVT